MKNYIALLLVLVTVSALGAQDYPVFELWNKTDKPLYFVAGGEKTKALNQALFSRPLIKLAAGKRAILKENNALVDKDKYTNVIITQNPNDSLVEYYTINSGTYMWLRVKEENGKVVFGPQTGPLNGLQGETERGYPLNKNVKSSDIKKLEINRSKMDMAEQSKKSSDNYSITD